MKIIKKSLQLMHVWALTVGLLTLCHVSLAAESNSAGDGIIDAYKDYSKAKYAVRWNVDSDELLNVVNLVPRYRYLVLFTSDQLIQASAGPKVQFGFFASKSEADTFVKEHASAFPGLTSVAVSRAEHQAVFASTSDLYWLAPQSHQFDAQSLQPLFRAAKDAYIAKNYRRSLTLYSVLALSADQQSRVWALELVGVNLERLGRRDKAIQTYRLLLAKNPEGNWVSRVQQRLRALETAADDGKEARRASKYENDIKDFYWRGNFGQTYSSVSQSGDRIPDRDVLDVITTYYDITAGTTKWRGHELEARLAGYDIMDLQEFGDDAKTRIKRFYLSYTHTQSGLNLVGGRQRDQDAGVFGYFDGGSIKYPLFGEKLYIGAKAGVPVRFSDFYDALDHKFVSFYGIYQLNDEWQFSAYLNHQTLYDEVDRAAYGGKTQYIGTNLSSSLHVDYDYEFAELNILRWSGNYAFNEKSRVSATYGLQRTPFLTATNIQVGQPYLNVEQYLRDEFNQRYLLYNALERTSQYEFGSLTYSHKVDEDLRVSADFYQSVSSDVPIFESSDGWITTDVAYRGVYRYSTLGVQAVVKGFFAQHDLATMSYRFGDTTFATINTLNFSERFRLGKQVFISPAMGLRQSKNKNEDASETRIRGSLGVAYKPWRSVELRLDAGNEVIEDVENKNSISSAFLYFSYQARF